MKKLINIFAIICVMVLYSGCQTDLTDEINALKNRIEAVEALCNTLNESISSANTLVKALEENDLITGITTTTQTGGKTSYVISFLSGSSITLTSGNDGEQPVIGISQYTDGYYYWTVQKGTGSPTWITSSLGLKIRASGTVPQLKVESGFWWISFDQGGSWTKLTEATGTDGDSVFSSINPSDNYISFTLVDGTFFQIATYEGVKKMKDAADNISQEIATLQTLALGIDQTTMVKSISQIMSGDVLTGYKFTLNNGETFSIYNGTDGAPFYLNIAVDFSTNSYYWKISYDGTNYNWIYDGDGNRVVATPSDGTPIIGVQDSLGVYYFTVTYFDRENPEWLLDSNGDKIQADGYSGYHLFDSVDISTTEVKITLADGSEVLIPVYSALDPSIVFASPKEAGTTDDMTLGSDGVYTPGVSAGKSYSVSWSISDATGDVKIEAIGLDDCVVTESTSALSGTVLSGALTFKTPATFEAGVTTSRVLVFVTWGSNVTMKVLEFKNI